MVLPPFYFWAQSNEFGELDIDKTWALKNSYTLNLAGAFKQQLNDEFKWLSPSLNLSLHKKFNPNWSLVLGLKNIYTQQTNRENFYELRPWLSPRLNVNVIPRMSFRQAATYEIRNFFYSESQENYEIQHRFRYRVHLRLNLAKDLIKTNNWSVETGFEWYFIKEPATGEQFSNSREFNLSFIKNIKSGQSFSLGYLFERVNIFRNPNSSNAHTFNFGYSF